MKQIREYLKLKGYYVIRNQLNIGSHKGLSDYQAIKDGRTYYIECKSQSPRAKQREDQIVFQTAIEKYGAKYVLASSIEDLKKAGI